MSLIASAIHNQSRQDHGMDDDELLFGSFCFTCGNSTVGQAYCSNQCRNTDLSRANQSPEFSPALSAVPPLVESSKSVCSTPPSSLNNSPSPRNGELELVEPPLLDLPALATKFEYGGTSLPVGFKYPPSYSLSYNNQVTYPSKELKSSSVGVESGFNTLDLKYRRKPNLPTQTVPAPLYFRHAAAAVNPSSPVTTPMSPRLVYTPNYSPARLPTPSTTFANPSALVLPPAVAVATSALPRSPRHSTRPLAVVNGEHSKSHGFLTGSAAVNSVKNELRRTSADLLMSPRIRALRGLGDIGGIPELEEDISEAAGPATESAFASYLFSHLTTGDPSDEEIASGRRGRTILQTGLPVEGSRSASVDSTFVIRNNNASTVEPRARPGRFIFGGRAPAIVPTRDIEELDLTPGRTISATLSSASPSPSPFTSPPASPPVANRGRASNRRDEVPSTSDLSSSVNPRGRSNMRGPGAVERDLSPVREPSESASRGRSANGATSRERGRQGSRSQARDQHAEVFRPLSRVVSKESVEEERGRRSRSRLAQGRGREVIISGAAYGHSDDYSP